MMRRAMHKQCATHVPDALHERTDELTNADLLVETELSGSVGNAREFVYLIRWPESGFVKVGFSSNGKRWRPFVRRGGRLLGLASFPRQDRGLDAATAEYLMHLGLRSHLPAAFGHRSEAEDFLGHKGAGWSECYVDDGSLALPMFTLAAEVVRSGDWDAYWLVREHWEQANRAECPRHRGQRDGYCGPCRSEQIGAA